jgi:hypothetical protein
MYSLKFQRSVSLTCTLSSAALCLKFIVLLTSVRPKRPMQRGTRQEPAQKKMRGSKYYHLIVWEHY